MLENKREATVKVIGAGFSGLTTAYYLLKAGVRVEVFEKESILGGKLGTKQVSHGLVERAANGILNTSRLQSLCMDLRVTLRPTQKAFRKRYIYRRGLPRTWPLSLLETGRLLWAAVGLFFLKRRGLFPQHEENLSSWGKRVFGSSFSHDILQTALQGVYADTLDNMSASLVFPKQKFIKKNKRGGGTVGFSGGMGELIQALRDKIENLGGVFHVDKKITSEDLLNYEGSVVLATSIQDSGMLLNKINPELSHAFLKVPMLSLLSVTTFWNKTESDLRGFGCLFPRSEDFSSLGVLFNSDIFEGRSKKDLRSETWIFDGENLEKYNDNEILRKIKLDRQRMLGNENGCFPKSFYITRWQQALPRYGHDLEKALTCLKNTSEKLSDCGLFITGNYLGRIGLSQILERSFRLSEQIVGRD